jgi:hypothetical protein
LLSSCPKLKLVFLNGCSTKGQVEALLSRGVPIVIATSAPVNDQKAGQFSTAFFKSLNNQSTIKEAFDAAKGALLTDNPNVEIHATGGIRRLSEMQKDDGLWGIYYTNEETLQWKLPMQSSVMLPSDYKENARLLEALVKSLANSGKQKAIDILEDEAEGTIVSLKPKLDLIISSFPEVLSNHLKKLLIPSSGSFNDGTFFDKIGKSRLQQIVITHQSLMQLLAFTMLAQLWKRSNDESFHIPPETAQMVRHFLKLKREERATYDFSKFISEIRHVLDQNETPYFMSEMKEVAKTMNQSKEHRDALQFLEHLNGKAFSLQLDDEEARQLCVIAEEKLAIIMQEIGFLSNYTMASVKTINVLNYRHYKNPKYRHNIVKLVQFGASPPLKESEKLKELLDCNSVLIYKETATGREFLNLSPFVIDNNSFNPKAEDAQLFFFYGCQPENDIFEFAHAYKPKDPLLPLNEEKYFALIKPQFEAFSQSLFKQSLATI